MANQPARTAARVLDAASPMRGLRRMALAFIVPAALVATTIAASSSAHAELPRLPPLRPLLGMDVTIHQPGV